MECSGDVGIIQIADILRICNTYIMQKIKNIYQINKQLVWIFKDNNEKACMAEK